ncbi:polyhydroxyalkanoic acid system family protein [Variovorax sp. YR216]|uniref:polyhydroxyalkanoic acid system family protein n=1 Tax=Variovorax sp. YR216 TaxID=1882828 RepID=UPI000895D16D|nr:polyhydroxyalkanoic acid system family protein [Variovorax sp. YR216]SEA73273.1 putative polyhydroxyalkanoic acid system protein [Variovorax sp. YR216]
MPDIQIERHHQLGLTGARAVARKHMQKVEQDFGMACTYDEGETRDTARFGRAGVDGSVEVSADTFRLEATLGMLFANFGDEIQRRLAASLDKLLGTATPSADDA